MIFVESTESFLVSSPGAALNSSLHPSLSSSLFFVSSILFTILCFHLLLLVNCAVKLQLSLTRGRGRMQVYLLLTSPLPLLHLILLLPLSCSLSLSLTFGLPSFPASKNRHTIHFLSPSTVSGWLFWWSEKNRCRRNREEEGDSDTDVAKEGWWERERGREEEKKTTKQTNKVETGLFFPHFFFIL